MYNRYIPQPDGSYRRNQIQEPKVPSRRPPPPPPPKAAVCPPPPENTCPPPPENTCSSPPAQPACPPPQAKPALQRKTPQKEQSSLGGFFRQLLPKELETADLLILLLLLLMAGDKEEDKSNALLTMALYFLM